MLGLEGTLKKETEAQKEVVTRQSDTDRWAEQGLELRPAESHADFPQHRYTLSTYQVPVSCSW